MKRWQSTLAGAATAAALIVGGGGIAYADSLLVVDSLQAEVSSISLGQPRVRPPGERRDRSQDESQWQRRGQERLHGLRGRDALGVDHGERPGGRRRPVVLPSDWETLTTTR